jgi:hypothetical protein
MRGPRGVHLTKAAAELKPSSLAEGVFTSFAVNHPSRRANSGDATVIQSNSEVGRPVHGLGEFSEIRTGGSTSKRGGAVAKSSV